MASVEKVESLKVGSLSQASPKPSASQSVAFSQGDTEVRVQAHDGPLCGQGVKALFKKTGQMPVHKRNPLAGNVVYLMKSMMMHSNSVLIYERMGVFEQKTPMPV
eukprot:1157577-Pelagomonas_calceolata.AAC.1